MLRSRYLTRCLVPAARAQNNFLRITVRGRAFGELNFWINNLRSIKPQPMQPHVRRADVVVDCDASDSALAGIVVRAPTADLLGLGIRRMPTDRERRCSSTL